MAQAKPVRRRIDEPRGDKGGRKPSKDKDFSALAFSKAAYALSVHDPRDLPRPAAPEIAFAGRSNAGKSSAINAIAGRRRLAFASKTPGRTQLINFFSVGDRAYLVDLPGYGYAGVPGAVREHWEALVGGYLASRPSLAAVVLVMDARHPLMPLDLRLVEFLARAERPMHVLLTKADKLSRQQARVTLDKVHAQLARLRPGATVQLFSAMKAEGIGEAAAVLTRLASAQNKAPAKGE